MQRHTFFKKEFSILIFFVSLYKKLYEHDKTGTPFL